MPDSPRPVRERLPLVDILRGVALAAMVVYHFSWDLAYHRFVDWNVLGDPAWRIFAATIAAGFLALAGVALVLAGRGGIDPAATMLRLAKIAAAAAAISIVTRIALPEGWIFFGILHLIAFGSLAGLIFLRAPPAVTLLAAAVVAAVPFLTRFPALDGTPLAFTGLAARLPGAFDFVPVFPWFAAMLVGIAIGRLIERGTIRLSPTPPKGWIGRSLALAGRWTLPVYLVHQVVLFGLVMAAAAVLPARPGVERVLFLRECERGCRAEGGSAERCAEFCGCVTEGLDGTGYFNVRNGDPELWPLASSAAAGCRIRDLPPD